MRLLLVTFAAAITFPTIASAQPPSKQVEVTNFPNPQNVSGSLEVTNLPAVQDVKTRLADALENSTDAR